MGEGGGGVKKQMFFFRKTIIDHLMFSSRFILFLTFLENRAGGGV